MSRKASGIAKGIAILMMLFHHVFYSENEILTCGRGQEVSFDPFSMGFVIDIAQLMKICVAVFVFITAYGTFRQISARLDAHKQNTSGWEARLSAGYALEHVVKLLINFQFVFLIFALMGFAFPEHSVFAVYGGEGPLNAAFYMLCDFFGLAKMLGTPTLNATWWYMSYALLLIFIMPAFAYLARRIGSLPMIALSFMLPLMASLDMSATFWRYAPTVMLGMMFAQYDTFEALDRRFEDHACSKRILGALVCVFVLIALLYLRKRLGFVWLFDALCAATVCRLAMHFEAFDVVLVFLGKHSMNMFFLHTFIYAYYFGAQIYSLHWFLFIYLVLVLVSLGCSMLIELLKKILRVNALRDWAVGKIRTMPIFI